MPVSAGAVTLFLVIITCKGCCHCLLTERNLKLRFTDLPVTTLPGSSKAEI